MTFLLWSNSRFCLISNPLSFGLTSPIILPRRNVHVLANWFSCGTINSRRDDLFSVSADMGSIGVYHLRPRYRIPNFGFVPNRKSCKGAHNRERLAVLSFRFRRMRSRLRLEMGSDWSKLASFWYQHRKFDLVLHHHQGSH